MLSELGTRRSSGTELVPCRTIREFEQHAIARGAATVGELVETAGAAVVAAIGRSWPALAGDRAEPRPSAVVLCGPGMNGGDGYVVARLLHEKGWNAGVIALGDASRLPAEAAAARQRLIDAGGRIDDATDAGDDPAGQLAPPCCDVVVDAILGSGARQPMPDGWSRALSGYAAQAEHLVCVDGHSALDLDSGESQALGPRAHLTVTFHRARPGHVLGRGRLLSGLVMVADIGLDEEWVQFCGPGSPRPLRHPDLWTRHLPPAAELIDKKPLLHKYHHGHALVLSGPPEHAGAARLAARAALRCGAGLVTLGMPDRAGLAAAGPDALMRRVVAGPDDLSALLDDGRVTSVCLGPGLGLERARLLVRAGLSHARAHDGGVSFLLDADALTAFSDDPRALCDMTSGRRVVMTPHAGEFARIFPDLSGGNLIDLVRTAAGRAGCTVLHKGAATVIAEWPGDRSHVIDAFDVPWLATAGAGDVLSGIITGLLARGLPPADAAATGAWLHVASARRFGPGLIADDLPEQLPAVFRGLIR